MAEITVEIKESSEGKTSKGTGYSVSYIGYGLEKATDGVWRQYDCEDGHILTNEKSRQLCEKIVTLIDDFMYANSERIIKEE